MSDTNISIIIPAYNCGNTILKTLDCLILQIDKNDEIIIIDDGSSDNTVEVIEKYIANQSKCLKLFTKSNGGPASARNVGIKNAKGQYLIFVDADDLPMEDYVSNLNSYITFSDKIDFAFGKYKRIDDDTEMHSISNTEYLGEIGSCLILESFLTWKTQISLWNSIFKRNIILSGNIMFDENRQYGEDVEFIAKYISECRMVYGGEELIYNFCYSKFREDKRINKYFISDIRQTEYYAINQFLVENKNIDVPYMKNYTLPSIALNILMRQAQISQTYCDFKTAIDSNKGTVDIMRGIQSKYAASYKKFLGKKLVITLFKTSKRIFYMIVRWRAYR